LSNQQKASGYTCYDVVKQATEFLENRLPSAQNIEMWFHFNSCAACRTYILQMILVRDTLRKLPSPAMPDLMREKLLQRLSQLARDRGDPS
jgi:hypothetical protein